MTSIDTLVDYINYSNDKFIEKKKKENESIQTLNDAYREYKKGNNILNELKLERTSKMREVEI